MDNEFFKIVQENQEEWEREGDQTGIDNWDIVFGGPFCDMDEDPDEQTHW